jgi:hypothetical protein
LQNLKVSELKAILIRKNIDIGDCLEKNELILKISTFYFEGISFQSFLFSFLRIYFNQKYFRPSPIGRGW